MGLKENGWQERVAWMRKAGVTDADWNSDGELIHATLGPLPSPPMEPLTEAQQKELEARVQAELDALAFASS